jgi:L-malate glycosyltransferase
VRNLQAIAYGVARGGASGLPQERRRHSVLLLARELDLGGSERQLCEMARALDRERFAVHVGCFRQGGIRAREIEAAGLPVVQFPLRSFRSPSDLWLSVRTLRRYVRRHEIRVVHAFDPPTNMFLGIAARFLGRARALTSQRSFRQLRTPVHRICLRLSDRVADGVVVNCEAIHKHLAFDEQVPTQRIHLCHNGLDSRRFQRGPVMRSNRLAPDALVIGTVCGLRPEKDLSTLLRAFATCQLSHPNLFLVVVGDGPLRADLESEAQALGVASRCLFQPTTADVVPWLSQIDIFVLPSVSEALSNALMEAMACECACVASRIGGNPELVQHGQTGLLFETGDAASLVEHLRMLIDDSRLRRRLGRRAAESIRAKFSLETAATRLGAIYEVVMGTEKIW